MLRNIKPLILRNSFHGFANDVKSVVKLNSLNHCSNRVSFSDLLISRRSKLNKPGLDKNSKGNSGDPNDFFNEMMKAFNVPRKKDFDDQNKTENNNSDDEKKSEMLKLALTYGLFLSIIVPALLIHHFSPHSRAREISYNEFINMYLENLNEANFSIVIENERKVYLKKPDGSDFMSRLESTLKRKNIDFTNIKITHSSKKLKLDRLSVALIGFYVWFFVKFLMYVLRPQKLRAAETSMPSMETPFGKKEFLPIHSSIKFSDVIGYSEQKQELKEFVDFMKNPDLFKKMGAKIPKGALLYGPPGTGKTLLAKAVAGESEVNFFAVTGSEFMQVFQGVGSQRVKDLFSQANKNAPSIIFIDEVDSIASNRAKSNMLHNEQISTINQLLTHMDGFKSQDNVVVLAATNRFDALDPAILRPGRFDRHIYLGPPDIESRIDMFKHYLQKSPLGDDIEFLANRLSSLATGFVGADIRMICNEASMIAARENATNLYLKHFEKAIDRVLAGSKSSVKLQEHERKIVAVREAAKTVVSWFSQFAPPVVSIIPRGQDLSYSQKYIKDEYLTNKEKFHALLKVMYGGRAAEEVLLQDKYTISSNELLNATKLVYQQVGVFGMDENVKNVSYSSLSNAKSYLFPPRPEYSEEIGDKMDEAASQIISDTYQQTKTIVLTHKDKILKLANYLYKNEHANSTELISILGPRPFTDEMLNKIDSIPICE